MQGWQSELEEDAGLDRELDHWCNQPGDEQQEKQPSTSGVEPGVEQVPQEVQPDATPAGGRGPAWEDFQDIKSGAK